MIVPSRYYVDIIDKSLNYINIDAAMFSHFQNDPPSFISIAKEGDLKTPDELLIIREFGKAIEGIAGYWLEFKKPDCENCFFYSGESLDNEPCKHKLSSKCNGYNYFKPKGAINENDI